MPVRKHIDPYVNPFTKLDPTVNVFVDKILKSEESNEIEIVFGEKLKTHKGEWLKKLNETKGTTCNELILEIGCHFGHSLEKMAQENSDSFFLGFDITFKRVYKAANRSKLSGLKNIASGFGNCSDLTPYFGENELSGVVIFFPDPWEKKEKQQKHRLINPDFVSSLSTAIKPGGFVWLKTDHKEYFDASCKTMEEGTFKVAPERPFFARHPYTSCFEEKFAEKGIMANERIWLNT